MRCRSCVSSGGAFGVTSETNGAENDSHSSALITASRCAADIVDAATAGAGSRVGDATVLEHRLPQGLAGAVEPHGGVVRCDVELPSGVLDPDSAGIDEGQDRGVRRFCNDRHDGQWESDRTRQRRRRHFRHGSGGCRCRMPSRPCMVVALRLDKCSTDSK